LIKEYQKEAGKENARRSGRDLREATKGGRKELAYFDAWEEKMRQMTVGIDNLTKQKRGQGTEK